MHKVSENQFAEVSFENLLCVGDQRKVPFKKMTLVTNIIGRKIVSKFAVYIKNLCIMMTEDYNTARIRYNVITEEHARTISSKNSVQAISTMLVDYQSEETGREDSNVPRGQAIILEEFSSETLPSTNTVHQTP